jgi:poly-beta-1,6-N-acetyl-D-glucosamine N-deacetylase PgaB
MRKLGKKPRIIVWPYGAYSEETVKIAHTLGMPFNLTLESDKANSLNDLSLINRELIIANPNTGDLAYMLNQTETPEPIRMIHVDLDYIYDADPIQQNRNLGFLLDRIKRFKINTVYLQAFADPDGDGNVDALYFPNRHLPMRADLFNRVAWQLRISSGVIGDAWMPVMAFDLGDEFFSKYGVKEYKTMTSVWYLLIIGAFILMFTLWSIGNLYFSRKKNKALLNKSLSIEDSSDYYKLPIALVSNFRKKKSITVHFKDNGDINYFS